LEKVSRVYKWKRSATWQCHRVFVKKATCGDGKRDGKRRSSRLTQGSGGVPVSENVVRERPAGVRSDSGEKGDNKKGQKR